MIAFPHTKKTGLVLGTAGVVILSPDSLLLRFFEGDIYTLTAGRGVMLATLTTLLLLLFPQLRQGFQWRAGVIYGFIYAVGLASFPLSIKHTHVANTVVILAITPLVAAIGARLFLNDNISFSTWFACIVAAAGVGIVFAPQLTVGEGLGELLALLTVLSLAGCAIVIRCYAHVNLIPGLAIAGVMVAIAYTPLGNWQLTPANMGLLTLNGMVVLTAFLFIIAASRRLTPPEVNLLFLLETVLAPLWVWLALNEIPPTSTFIAGGIILAILTWHSLAAIRSPQQ